MILKNNPSWIRLYGTLTMFQALIVRIQQEVLEAVRDVMIGQELQIILIKLKLQRMLLQNLQTHEEMHKDSQTERGEEERQREKVSMCDSWIVSSCCDFTSLQSKDDQLGTEKNVSCPCGGKG